MSDFYGMGFPYRRLLFPDVKARSEWTDIAMNKGMRQNPKWQHPPKTFVAGQYFGPHFPYNRGKTMVFICISGKHLAVFLSSF